MPHEFKPEARSKMIEAVSGVIAVNPELVAGVIAFVTMIDGSVLTLYTCCCPVHATLVCETGLKEAVQEMGSDCPRQG